MEESKSRLVDYWEQLVTFYNAQPQEYQYGIIAIAVILFIIIIIPKGKKKGGKKGKKFTGIQVQSFQIAQLSRDAFVKIKNSGDTLILTEIETSPQVVIKNQYAGHHLTSGEEYRLLIEATPGTRIPSQVTMYISGLGTNGKSYTQKLLLR